MIADIRDAAEAVGITAVITNSDARIETQLNRLTRHEDLPLMLISWDLVTSITIDSITGFLNHPTVNVTCLLMDKAETTEKELKEATAEKMGVLFTEFIQELHSIIVKFQTENTVAPISGAQYTLVPSHGGGNHSGILGTFTMKARIRKCVDIVLPTPTVLPGIGRDKIGSTKIG